MVRVQVSRVWTARIQQETWEPVERTAVSAGVPVGNDVNKDHGNDVNKDHDVGG